MMKLLADETVLIGKWLDAGGAVVADDTCRRIDWLIGGQLIELGSNADGWDQLYRDPSDGRLWELTYPESEHHGGGPPRLSIIDEASARVKYGASVIAA